MMTTSEKGAAAETVALLFYQAEGFELLTRNYRTRAGEIDLVLRRDGLILFVEVKGRKEFQWDEAWWARWREKKRKIRAAVSTFLITQLDRDESVDEWRLEIVYVTQGRVTERFEGEPFF